MNTGIYIRTKLGPGGPVLLPSLLVTVAKFLTLEICEFLDLDFRSLCWSSAAIANYGGETCAKNPQTLVFLFPASLFSLTRIFIFNLFPFASLPSTWMRFNGRFPWVAGATLLFSGLFSLSSSRCRQIIVVLLLSLVHVVLLSLLSLLF